MRGRSPPEYGMPTIPKRYDIEITQSRNLDVECLPVRLRRTDPDARHDAQRDWLLGSAQTGFSGLARNSVNPTPSTFVEPSFSLRRLRTTPARKPRTECCCQPVAFIIAAIVAPVGCPSNPRTASCLSPAAARTRLKLLDLRWLFAHHALERGSLTFFRVFALQHFEYLSVTTASGAVTAEAPQRPQRRRGGIR